MIDVISAGELRSVALEEAWKLTWKVVVMIAGMGR
jgi:hypothetical protein